MMSPELIGATQYWCFLVLAESVGVFIFFKLTDWTDIDVDLLAVVLGLWVFLIPVLIAYLMFG